MIEILDGLRPTALPAIVFLFALPAYWIIRPPHTLRFFLIASLLALVLVAGPRLAVGLTVGVTTAYALTEWIARRNRHQHAFFIAGLVLLHLLYWACFFLPIPPAFKSADLRPEDRIGVFVLFSGIGYSFFRIVSYYHERVRGATRSVAWHDFLAYVFYFPQLRHGPVERATGFVPKLANARMRWSPKDIAHGAARIGVGIIGLILLNGLQSGWARLAGPEFGNDLFAQLERPGELDGAQLILLLHMPGVLLYVLESSYAHLALGVSRAFGVRGSEAYRLPFLARDPREWWHRWNITISMWLRDYAYIPLGGRTRHKHLNIILVFVYCGLLHGLEWRLLVWGLYTGGTLAAYVWIRDRLAARTNNPQPPKSTWARHAATLVGRLLTIHWFCLGVVMVVDPTHCGSRVLHAYLNWLAGLIGCE